MNTEAFRVFFSLLTIATLVATVAVLALRFIGPTSGGGQKMLASLATHRMAISAAITSTSC
jgi:hypothetical protein